MANQFFVQPAQFGQGLQQLAGGVERFKAGQAQEQAQQAATQRQEAARQALLEAEASGDPRAYSQVAINFPEIREQAEAAYGFTSDVTRDIAREGYSRAAAMKDPVAAGKVLRQTAQRIKEAGGRPIMTTADADALEAGDPEALRQVRNGLALLTSPQEFEAIMGGGVEAGAPDPSNVREYQYFQSLSEPQKREYLNMKRASQGFQQGDVYMTRDQLQPTVATPVTEAGAGPTTQAEQQAILTRQAAEKAATTSAAEQAIAKSGEAYERLSTVQSAIPLYDEAIKLIKDGAGTGALASRFPSMRDASVALDNVQRQLGLGVISSVTFGALSEAELEVAMQTALPTGLEGPELIKWLETKKAAQQKLGKYLEEAAQFLGTPGNTVADWMSKKKQNKGVEKKTAPDAAVQYLKENPGMADAFRAKYGYLPEGF